MNNQVEEKPKTSNRKKVILAALISILTVFIIITIYLIGYHIGIIGVSADISKQLDIIKITPESIGWNNSDILNIFGKSKFGDKGIIAPNSSGTYRFVVENDAFENICYKIKFIEENFNQINMKYRLKLDNVYIIGSRTRWASIEELAVEDLIITPNSKTMFTLEWKWFETPYDTMIGEQDYAEYQLYLNFAPDYIEGTDELV